MEPIADSTPIAPEPRLPASSATSPEQRGKKFSFSFWNFFQCKFQLILDQERERGGGRGDAQLPGTDCQAKAEARGLAETEGDAQTPGGRTDCKGLGILGFFSVHLLGSN